MEHPAAVLANRYLEILDDATRDPFWAFDRMCHDHLKWMCFRIIHRCVTWPEDKTGRWIGFVQGVLAAQHLIDVDVERKFSRPLFHQHYIAEGIRPPETEQR